MKMLTLAAAIAGMLAFTLQASAQSADRPADAPVAKPAPAAEGNPASDAGTGSSAARAKSQETFTHGESKRCASMSGADKELCDKEEATKAQGKEAEDLSARPQRSPKQ